MKKFFIKTLGCAMNTADTEKINMILLQNGFIKASKWENADIVIFNTCSVRQKGEDRVFGMIREVEKQRKLNKKNEIENAPGLYVGITGCMVRKTGMNEKFLEEEDKKRDRAKKIELLSEVDDIFNQDDKLFPRSKNIDFTFRIEEIKYLPSILSTILGEKIGVDHTYDDYLKQKQLRENPSSASIIIQTGCDNYCTYCIVPYTRGREVSRPMEDILEEIQKAVEGGAKEINLIGQNVNSYGKQFLDKTMWNEEESKWEKTTDTQIKSPFFELLEKINQINGIDRIRFTSSNPHDMTQDILESHFILDKTCNYLHFALQSGSDAMLKKMNRKHSYSDFKKMVDFLRNKDPLFGISTDIIVGFSGETDEMFEETLKAVRECEFDFIYNAKYSTRKGTIASKIYPDDIPDEVKIERWHKLNNLLKENVLKRNNLMLGREEDVMISGIKDGLYFGRTRNFKEVYFSGDENSKIGVIQKVKINNAEGFILKGELVK